MSVQERHGAFSPCEDCVIREVSHDGTSYAYLRTACNLLLRGRISVGDLYTTTGLQKDQADAIVRCFDNNVVDDCGYESEPY